MSFIKMVAAVTERRKYHVCQLCRKVARVVASHRYGRGREDREGIESCMSVTGISLYRSNLSFCLSENVIDCIAGLIQMNKQ
jgi:hypothetical protein